MRSDSLTFRTYNEAAAKSPRFVVRIGYDVDSLAITSHEGISGVTAGTVLEGLLADPTVTTQRLRPDQAVAEIGSASFALVDVDEQFTDEVRERLLDGAGLRGKRVQFYVGYEGLDFDDFQLVATQTISSVTFTEGRYEVACLDIQRSLRTSVFEPVQTTLASTLLDTDTVVNLTSVARLQRVAHGPGWSDAPSSTVGYIKIKSEIIRYTSIVGSQLQGCTRGVFNTVAATYVVDPATPAERREKVTEYIYLELPAVKLAYAVLTGVLYGSADTLPAHWHLGIDTALVRAADFTGIGADLWNPADDTLGFPLRFEGLTKVDGKRFLETEVYLATGLFAPVYSDGALGLRRMIRLREDAAVAVTLDESNVISCGALEHDMRSLHNVFVVNWSWNGTEFRRATSYIDPESVAKHGQAERLTLNFKGIHGAKHTDGVIFAMLDMYRDRFAGPPQRITVDVLPSLNRLEVGDVVRLRLANVRDFAARDGATIAMNRAMEIQNVSTDYRGAVSLELFGSTADPSVESPTAAVSSLPDAFYTSAGTSLAAVPGVVIGGNTMTAAPVTPLAGNAVLTNGGAVYYHNGDLTIGAGVDLLIADNVQLRVKGFLTVNGSINGAARGKAGVADDGRALYVSVPSAGDVVAFGPFYESIPGDPGYVGSTRAFDGVLGVRSFPLTTTNYYNSRTAAFTQSAHPVAPRLLLKVSGSTLLGLPSDLRGSGGAPGGRAQQYDESTRSVIAPAVLGGTGGNGGAGLAIICRGMAFGANGFIDLSGANTASPAASADTTNPGFSAHPGAGAPGGPGTLMILLDGGSLSVPDVAGNKYRAKVGTAAISGTPLPRDEYNFFNHSAAGTTDGLASPASGRAHADFVSINALDMSGAALLIQHIPAVETIVADQLSVVPAPISLTATSAEQAINVSIAQSGTFDAVELYMSSNNDRSNATKVFEGLATVVSVRVPDGATRYFWARNKREGRLSAFTPVSSVAGVSGTSVGGLICRGNCEAYNNGVRKNGGASAWDSDAYSPESFAQGVFVSFQPSQDGSSLMVGLNEDPETDSAFNGINYAWYCRSDHTLQIYESGVAIASYGEYTTATKLEIRYDGQRVVYYKDGAVQRMVNVAGLTLFVDSSFHTPGGAIRNLKYGPIATAEALPWVARGNCFASVSAFGKSGGTAAWDSDVYSQRLFPSGCMLTFQADSTTHELMVGLNSDPTTDQVYTSLDFAWHMKGTGVCQIYESGVFIGAFGAHTINTVFSIRYDGQQVEYLKDGVTQRVVQLRGGLFFLDSSFLTPGGSVRNVAFGPITTAAAIPFVTVGSCIATANTLRKYAGGAGAYDAGAYSPVAYDACSATAQPLNANNGTTQGYFALNTDPLTDLLESSLDYGFKFGGVALSTIVNGVVTNYQTGYATTDVCQIKYDGEVVRFYVNGVEIRAVADPGKKFFLDCGLFQIGSGLVNLEFRPLGNAPSVPFAVTGNCIAGSSTIKKVGGTSAWDSQAYSTQAFEAGCHLSFQVPATTCHGMLGINQDPLTDASFGSIDYAFFIRSDSTYQIYESGTGIGSLVAFAAGDDFAIRYDGQQVQYLRNGAIVRTVPSVIGKTFYFDSSLWLPGTELRNVSFRPLTTAATIPWITRGNAVATATTVRKIGGADSWDSDAYSSQAYRGGCVLSFNPEPAGTAPGYKMVGLEDNPAAGTDYTFLEHAWFMHTASGAAIYESGVQVQDLGASGQWTTATAFSIVYDGQTVRYLRDGVVVREKYNPGKTFYGRVALRSAGEAVRGLFFGSNGQATPVPFIARTANVAVSDVSAQKVSGGALWGDADVVSIVGYPKCFTQFKAGQTTGYIMAGLNSDPYTDSNFTSIDAAWYMDAAGVLKIYENGAHAGDFGTYTTATLLAITYDGTNVRYYKDGVLQRTLALSVSTMFFDSSFYAVGSVLKEMKFGPGTVLPAVDTSDIAPNAVTEVTSVMSASETRTVEDFVGGDLKQILELLVPAKSYDYTALITATCDAWQTGSSDLRMFAGAGPVTNSVFNGSGQLFPVTATASPGARATVLFQVAVAAGNARYFGVFALNAGSGTSTFNARNITLRVEQIKK